MAPVQSVKDLTENPQSYVGTAVRVSGYITGGIVALVSPEPCVMTSITDSLDSFPYVILSMPGDKSLTSILSQWKQNKKRVQCHGVFAQEASNDAYVLSTTVIKVI